MSRALACDVPPQGGEREKFPGFSPFPIFHTLVLASSWQSLTTASECVPLGKVVGSVRLLKIRAVRGTRTNLRSLAINWLTNSGPVSEEEREIGSERTQRREWMFFMGKSRKAF